MASNLLFLESLDHSVKSTATFGGRASHDWGGWGAVPPLLSVEEPSPDARAVAADSAATCCDRANQLKDAPQ